MAATDSNRITMKYPKTFLVPVFLASSVLMQYTARAEIKGYVSSSDVAKTNSIASTFSLFEAGFYADAELELIAGSRQQEHSIAWNLEVANGFLLLTSLFKNKGDCRNMDMAAGRARYYLLEAYKSVTGATPKRMAAAVCVNLASFSERFDGDKKTAIFYYEQAASLDPASERPSREIARLKASIEMVQRLAGSSPQG